MHCLFGKHKHTPPFQFAGNKLKLNREIESKKGILDVIGKYTRQHVWPEVVDRFFFLSSSGRVLLFCCAQRSMCNAILNGNVDDLVVNSAGLYTVGAQRESRETQNRTQYKQMTVEYVIGAASERERLTRD